LSASGLFNLNFGFWAPLRKWPSLRNAFPNKHGNQLTISANLPPWHKFP